MDARGALVHWFRRVHQPVHLARGDSKILWRGERGERESVGNYDLRRDHWLSRFAAARGGEGSAAVIVVRGAWCSGIGPRSARGTARRAVVGGDTFYCGLLHHLHTAGAAGLVGSARRRRASRRSGGIPDARRKRGRTGVGADPASLDRRAVRATRRAWRSANRWNRRDDGLTRSSQRFVG